MGLGPDVTGAQLVTRRLFVALPSWLSWSCSDRERVVSGELDSKIGAKWVVVGLRGQVTGVRGRRLGRLHLPEGCQFGPIFGPDGRSAAYIAGSVFDPGRTLRVVVLVDGVPSTKLIDRVGETTALAISPTGGVMAVASVSRDVGHRRLVVVGSNSELRADLSDLARRLMSEVESLSISADGNIAFGCRERVIVAEVSSAKILFEGDGRFPALAPDGGSVAFLNGSMIVLRHLTRRTSTSFRLGFRCSGVGGWHPDGDCFLASAWVTWSLKKSLLLVNSTSGNYVEVGQLGEGDFGNRCQFMQNDVLPFGV